VLAIAAVLVAVRLGDDTDGVGSDVLTRARAAAEDAGTYYFSLTQGITGDPSVRRFTFRMSGSVDVKRERTEMRFTSDGGPLAINCNYIAEGRSFYTQVHETRRSEIGATWVKSDLGRPFAVSGFQFTPEELYNDPQEVFDDLTETGSGEVRGVRTTNYRATLDLASVLPRFVSPAPTGVPTGLPATLAFDDQGRLVRLTFEFGPTSGAAATATVRFRSTMDLFDFGKPVSIEIPTDVKEGSPSEGATACYPTSVAPNPAPGQ
jgi:hypothetical protein